MGVVACLQSVKFLAPWLATSKIPLSRALQPRLTPFGTLSPALTYHPEATNHLPGDCSMKKAVLALAILSISFAYAPLAQAQDAKPLLLRQPTLSHRDVAFMYGNDLWKVSREGGDAIRLTAGPGIKRDPHFSPDGQWIAFTGDYDGKLNVYIISASGGTPRRVTFHAGPDIVSGWTPDGKNILFASSREGF